MVAFLAIIIVVLITINLLLALYRLKTRNGGDWRKAKRTPPGELGLPYIGETMDFYRAQQKNRLLEDFISPRIRKHGDTFKTRLMGSPTVIVNGARANRFFLSNEFKLVVSSWPSSAVQLMGTTSIMEKTGEQHRRLRALLAPCLGATGVEGLVPKVCNVVKAHLANHWEKQLLEGDKTVALYRSAKLLTFTVMCQCLLEMEHVQEGMFECFEKVLEGVFSPPINVPGTSFWRAKRARAEIERILLNVVRDKRKQMEDQQQASGANSSNYDARQKVETTSLLSGLVGALIRGEITEVEVIDNVVLLIFAAHDTTSFAIAMTFKMLAQHPDCYSRLLQEHMDIRNNRTKDEAEEILTIEAVMKMKYTWQVARETMRLFPPIFGSFRRAIEDIEFDGFTIPKGWKVLWTSYGTHFSEEYFVEAEKFDPNRFEEPMPPYVYVAFGGGPRVCAGYQLAKLNILIFIHLVVTQYNWSLVQPDESIVMDPLPFPSQGMPIRISPKDCINN